MSRSDLILGARGEVGLIGGIAEEGSKGGIGSLSGLSIETSIPLAERSSLSSSSTVSVALGSLEFVLISSAG